MLGSILLESAEPAHLSVLARIQESGLIKKGHDDSIDSALPGLLCYLSPNNLSILFDCLMESYKVAHEFNLRPGLRSLVQKLARLPFQANLLRQSITSFAFYLNTLFQISRHDGEAFSISNIKRILTGEKLLLDITPTSPHKNTVKDDSGAPTGFKHRDLLKGEVNIEWVIRRLYEACNQISSTYQKLHKSEVLVLEQDSGFLETLSSSFSTPQTSPHRFRHSHETMDESLDLSNSKAAIKTSFSELKVPHKFNSPFKNVKSQRLSVDEVSEQDSKESLHFQNNQKNHLMRRREEEMIHLTAWAQLIVSMLELLLGLPTLQFKSVLPAVFPAVTSLITTVSDPKVRQLVCDVVRRCGSIYGIV